jgi:hypothetical protein
MENLEVVKELLNKGANIEAKDCKSWTPLIYGKTIIHFAKLNFVL